MDKTQPIVPVNSQHVWPNRKGVWRVMRYGATRPSRVFANRSDALRYARALVRKAGADLYLHRTNGMIERRERYATVQ